MCGREDTDEREREREGDRERQGWKRDRVAGV